jgi:hypothetical protein
MLPQRRQPNELIPRMVVGRFKIDRKFGERVWKSLVRGSFLRDARGSVISRIRSPYEDYEDQVTRQQVTARFVKSISTRRDWWALKRTELLLARKHRMFLALYDEYGPEGLVDRLRNHSDLPNDDRP